MERRRVIKTDDREGVLREESTESVCLHFPPFGLAPGSSMLLSFWTS
jgi:hypothetical protein